MNNINEKILSEFIARNFSGADIKFIGKGWSSFAFQIGDKILRFPRRNMGQCLKEQSVCDLIRGHISVPIPKIEIIDDAEHPYAMHQIIPGNLWDDKYESFDAATQTALAQDCAKFLSEIHAINPEKLSMSISHPTGPEFTEFNHVRPLLENYYSKSQIGAIEKKYNAMQKTTSGDFVFCHGDLHGDNSVLDDCGRLVGVFDFGNCEVHERAWDFVQLFIRAGPDFVKKILARYKAITGIDVEIERVETLALMEIMGSINSLNTSDSLQDIRESALNSCIEKLLLYIPDQKIIPQPTKTK